MDKPAALQIDIVSDVVCPWCYVGKRQLEKAVASWQQDNPELPPPALRWRPFQLNPDVPPEGLPRADYLRQKFGSADVSRFERVRAAGRAVGLELRLEAIVTQPNTLKAHGLIEATPRPDMQTELAEAFFKAYFLDGRDLSKDATLREVAAGVGLGDDVIDAVLNDPAATREVAAADAELRGYGVSGVPFFIFGNADDRESGQRLAVSGAQGAESLLQAMRQVLPRV